MISKRDLIKIFLNEINIEPTEEKIKECLWAWWYNPISKTSFRLTSLGSVFLSETLQLQSYKLKLTTDIKATSKNFLLLDKHLTTPFYIKDKKTIIFYGERDSLMVILSGYNLQQYLESF